MRRRQAGFTLTELMVVVTIIGVLVTLAIVYMRPHVRPIDVATRLGDLFHEANRRAVALGPVRADVAVALGTKARTQVLAVQSGSQVAFTLYRLQEDDPPATTGNWLPIETYTTDANTLAVKWAKNVGNYTMPDQTTVWTSPPPLPPPIPPDTGFVCQCRPDGTCDSVTLFFQAVLPGPPCDVASPNSLYEQCARLSVMPLGGAIATYTDWL